MRKALLSFAVMAAAVAANAQTTYNYFDPADCDSDGWLWLDTQEKLDKYVGFQGLGPDPKIMLLSASYENADGEYPEPYTDAEIKGYNAAGVQGGEGSWTGGIVLNGSKTANGSDSPNGGGFMLHLPDLAQFDVKLSTESEYICLGIQGGAGWIEPVDCALIQTYLRMGAFVNKPLAATSQYTWNNIQNVSNVNTGLKLAAAEGNKVTGLIRNNRGDDLLVQAIRIFTYTDESGASVKGIEADNDAPVEFYNIQGVKASGDEPGVYIRRQGSKASKVIVK